MKRRGGLLFLMINQKSNFEFIANPLDYHNQRRTDELCPHFITTYFALNLHNSVKIINWIYENTESRFFFGQQYTKGSSGIFEYLYCVAFEYETDSVFFNLNLVDLNRR